MDANNILRNPNLTSDKVYYSLDHMVRQHGIQMVLDQLTVIADEQEAAGLNDSAVEQWGHIRAALEKVPQHKPPYWRV